jgi:hypothetical protein
VSIFLQNGLHAILECFSNAQFQPAIWALPGETGEDASSQVPDHQLLAWMTCIGCAGLVKIPEPVVDPNKREQRRIKKEIERAGSQRRRRQWKRDLREDPEEAPYSEEDFGRYSTVELNGMDRDNTRRRGRPIEEPSLAESPDRDGPIEFPQD